MEKLTNESPRTPLTFCYKLFTLRNQPTPTFSENDAHLAIAGSEKKGARSYLYLFLISQLSDGCLVIK